MRHISNFLIILTVLTVATVIASPVGSWKHADKKGNVYIGVSTVQSGTAKEISADNDEYPADYAFPAIDPKYWKKSGNDIVAMTPAEQAVVDEATKTKATADENLTPFEDALLGYLADKFNKTKEEVRAEVKNKVNKDKKEKSK
jgi:hypothetical protein